MMLYWVTELFWPRSNQCRVPTRYSKILLKCWHQLADILLSSDNRSSIKLNWLQGSQPLYSNKDLIPASWWSLCLVQVRQLVIKWSLHLNAWLAIRNWWISFPFYSAFFLIFILQRFLCLPKPSSRGMVLDNVLVSLTVVSVLSWSSWLLSGAFLRAGQVFGIALLGFLTCSHQLSNETASILKMWKNFYQMPQTSLLLHLPSNSLLLAFVLFIRSNEARQGVRPGCWLCQLSLKRTDFLSDVPFCHCNKTFYKDHPCYICIVSWRTHNTLYIWCKILEQDLEDRWEAAGLSLGNRGQVLFSQSMWGF